MAPNSIEKGEPPHDTFMMSYTREAQLSVRQHTDRENSERKIRRHLLRYKKHRKDSQFRAECTQHQQFVYAEPVFLGSSRRRAGLIHLPA
jgi:hypothetical protein